MKSATSTGALPRICSNSCKNVRTTGSLAKCIAITFVTPRPSDAKSNPTREPTNKRSYPIRVANVLALHRSGFTSFLKAGNSGFSNLYGATHHFMHALPLFPEAIFVPPDPSQPRWSNPAHSPELSVRFTPGLRHAQLTSPSLVSPPTRHLASS